MAPNRAMCARPALLLLSRSRALASGLHGCMKSIRTFGPLAARVACRGPLCGPSIAEDLGWLACGTRAPGDVRETRLLLLSVVAHSRVVCTAVCDPFGPSVL